MDNKAYLDQIAVKGKVKSSGPILTPILIKLIAAGAIMLITMAIVGSVISSSNAKVTQIYERAYLRITNLAEKDNPIEKYYEKVRDSALRANALALLTSLHNSNVTLSGISGNIGIKPGNISSTVSGEESTNLATLEANFEEAILNGTLDRVYASNLHYQISMLLAIEAEARAKTSNAQFAELLDQSTRDLTTLETKFSELNTED